MRHVEVLEESDSLRRSFLGSLAVHGLVFAAISASMLIKPSAAEQWGDPNSAGGGAVGVTAVKSIPLPSRSGPVNRLANDTKSQVPTPPKAEPKKAVRREDPDAIALKTKGAKQRASRDRYTSDRTDTRPKASNQIYSSAGQAAVSPIYGLAPGSGGVGVGTGAPFGTRFGAYTKLVQDRVARQWRTTRWMRGYELCPRQS